MAKGLNDNHRRALRATLEQIDKLLTDAEHSATATVTPFAHVLPNLTPVQQRVLGDYVAELRERMVSAAKALGLALRTPSVRASTAITTDLNFAEIAIEEVAPSRLRGYGELDHDTALLVECLEADLTRAVQRLRRFFELPGGDLAGR